MVLCCFLVGIQKGSRWSLLSLLLHENRWAFRAAPKRLAELWQVHSTEHPHCMEASWESPYIAYSYCHRFSRFLFQKDFCLHTSHLRRIVRLQLLLLKEDSYVLYRLLNGQRILTRSLLHRHQIYLHCQRRNHSNLRYTFSPNLLVYDERTRVQHPFIYHLLSALREHGISHAKEPIRMFC